jgi:CHAD domain-containing protein
MQQLEQEVKLEIGPDWSLPDLSGVLPGVRAHPMPDLELDTTYFDTPDLRLAHRHVSLRFRRETEALPRSRRRASGSPHEARTSEVWTIKLPSSSDGAVLARTELTWEAPASGPARTPPGRPRTAASRPKPPSGRRRPAGGDGLPRRAHPEAAEFVQAIALGRPLVPVAHLVTTRQRTELRTSDGRRLAEIDHDMVSGKALAGIDDGLGRDGDEVRFSEVEVELAEGSSLEILEAVVDKLQDSGAKATTGGSKLATVLKLSAVSKAPRRRRRGPLMAEVLQQQAGSCLDTLIDHDPAIRAGDPDPEHIHRARVATRRLRTVLRGFAPLLSGSEAGPPSWFGELNDDLKWFGGVLGAARDSDVRLQALEADCGALPSLDAPGAAALLGTARERQVSCHATLLEAIAKGRYLQLLRALENLSAGDAPAAATAPAELSGTLSRPAATEMPSLAQRQWRSTVKSVGSLGKKPSDEQLHRVRIHTKRLRYMAETAAPVLRRAEDRRAAARAARAATALQDVLGELHDAVVNEQWLRDAAGTRKAGRANPAALVATGVAAGQLIATARVRQGAQRLAWTAAWERLDRKKLLRWLGPS